MKKIKSFLFLVLPILMYSCNDSVDIAVKGTQEEQIEAYIAATKLTVTEKQANGLRYCQTKSGIGPSVIKGQTITVNYNGKFMSGKSFDSGSFPFVLGAGTLVAGFEQGVAKMKVGEKATIIFPSALGYGSATRASIPGNSPLAFEIEVVSSK